jgi:hypothetical protein
MGSCLLTAVALEPTTEGATFHVGTAAIGSILFLVVGYVGLHVARSARTVPLPSRLFRISLESWRKQQIWIAKLSIGVGLVLGAAVVAVELARLAT